MRDLLETMGRVEARGKFVGKRLVVDKAICACRADGLLVKMLGVKYAALDTCDLRTDKHGAVLEILRAILRPDLELSVVRDQGLDMLQSLAGRYGVAGCRLGECAVEVILCRFEH